MNEDWEEWNGSTPFWVHCAAGSTAGLMEHVAIFPIDTLKTHLQVATRRTVGVSGAFSSFIDSSRLLLAAGGIRRLWRGTSAVIAGSVPAHCLYFSVYEKAKESFGANAKGHHPIAAAASGGAAVLMHDCIMTPLDVCKQRMQLGHFSSLQHTMTETLAAEGISAFFRSLPATLAMNIPFGMVLVAVNESMKRMLSGGDSRPSTAVVLASSAVAGGVAGALTNPLDVIKTRLQTQHFECSLGEGGFCPPDAAETCGRRQRHETSAVIKGKVLRQGTAAAEAAAGEGIPLTISSSAGGAASAPAAEATMALPTSSSRRAVRFDGIATTLRHVYMADGIAGFTRGLHMRLLVFVPASAISWTTYETVKGYLIREGE